MSLVWVFNWIGEMVSIALGFTFAALAVGLACNRLWRQLLLAADLALLMKFFRRARRHGWIKTPIDDGR